MVYQLFNTGKIPGAIAIFFLLINTLDCSATEYVFTAPPEMDRQIVEIPASDTEYPLYECTNESSREQTEQTNILDNDVLDSHNCTCTDCEEELENSVLEQEFSPEIEVEAP